MKALYKYFILAHFPPWFYKKGFEEKSINNVFTRMEIQGYKFGENIKINITVPRQGNQSASSRYLSIMTRGHLNLCLLTFLFIGLVGSFLSWNIVTENKLHTAEDAGWPAKIWELVIDYKGPLICCQPIQLVFVQRSELHTLRVCLNPPGSPLLLASSVDNMRVCTQVRERVQYLLWISHWRSYT